MELGERVARAVLVVVDGVATSMSMTRGIHQTSVAYRIPRTSLEVLRSMGRESLLMVMEGIRDPGAIGLLQEKACKFIIHPD